MAISQGLCLSYKQEILSGLHHNDHEYKIALFKSAATLNKYITTYTGLTEEVEGTGYTTGGKVLSGFTTSLIGDFAILDFTVDPSWEASSFTARGAVLYNNSLVGKNTVAVFDFGTDYTCVEGTFTVEFPQPLDSTALIRIV
jgi:hypothetical protein